jgi:hypothetical protein
MVTLVRGEGKAILDRVQDSGSLILEDGDVIEPSLKKEILGGDSLGAGDPCSRRGEKGGLVAAAGGEAKNIEVGKIAQPLPGEGRFQTWRLCAATSSMGRRLIPVRSSSNRNTRFD